MKTDADINAKKMLDMIDLSNAVYMKHTVPVKNFVLRQEVCHGNVVVDCDKLKAQIFTSTDDPNGVYVVFRGSQHISNWTTHNVPLLFNIEPKAYNELVDKTMDVVHRQYPNKIVHLTGHSAGGYMAAYGFSKYDVYAHAIEPRATKSLVSSLKHVGPLRSKKLTVLNDRSIASDSRFQELFEGIIFKDVGPNHKNPMEYVANHSLDRIRFRFVDEYKSELGDIEEKERYDPIQAAVDILTDDSTKREFAKLYDMVQPTDKEIYYQQLTAKLGYKLSQSNNKKALVDYQQQILREKAFFESIAEFTSEHVHSPRLQKTILKAAKTGSLVVEMQEHLLALDLALPGTFNTAFAGIAAVSGPVGIVLGVASTLLSLRDLYRSHRKSSQMDQIGDAGYQMLSNKLAQIEGLIRQVYESMSANFERVLTNQEHLRVMIAAGFMSLEAKLNQQASASMNRMFDLRILQMKKHRELLLQDYRKTLYQNSQLEKIFNTQDACLQTLLTPKQKTKLEKLLTNLEFWISVEACSDDLIGITEYTVVNDQQIRELFGPRESNAQKSAMAALSSSIDVFEYIGFLAEYAKKFDEWFDYDSKKLFNFRVWSRAVNVYLAYADKLEQLDNDVVANYQFCLATIIDQCNNFNTFMDFIRGQTTLSNNKSEVPLISNQSQDFPETPEVVTKSQLGKLLAYLQSEYASVAQQINQILFEVNLETNYIGFEKNLIYQRLIQPIKYQDGYSLSTVLNKDLNIDAKINIDDLLQQLKTLEYLILAYFSLLGKNEEAKQLLLHKGMDSNEFLKTDLNSYVKPNASGPPCSTSMYNHAGYYDWFRTATLTIKGRSFLYALTRNAQGIELYRYDITMDNGQWEKMASGPAWSDADGYGAENVRHTANLFTVTSHNQQFLYLACRSRTGLKMQYYDPSENVWTPCCDGPTWADTAGYGKYEHFRTITMIPMTIKKQMSVLALVRGPTSIELFSYDIATNQWTDLTVCNGPKWSSCGYNTFSYYWTFNAVMMVVEGQQTLFTLMRIPTGIELFQYDMEQKCWHQKATAGWWLDQLHYHDAVVTHTVNAEVVGNKLCVSVKNFHTLEILIYDPAADTWERRYDGPQWSNNNGYGQPRFYWTIRTASFVYGENSYLVKTIRNVSHYEVHLHHIEANRWYCLKQSPVWPENKCNYKDPMTLAVKANIVESDNGPMLVLLIIRDKKAFDMYYCRLSPILLNPSLELETIDLYDANKVNTCSDIEHLVMQIKERAKKLHKNLLSNGKIMDLNSNNTATDLLGQNFTRTQNTTVQLQEIYSLWESRPNGDREKTEEKERKNVQRNT